MAEGPDQAAAWAQANPNDPRSQDILAKSWAHANPDDPRSAQIIEKLQSKYSAEPGLAEKAVGAYSAFHSGLNPFREVLPNPLEEAGNPRAKHPNFALAGDLTKDAGVIAALGGAGALERTAAEPLLANTARGSLALGREAEALGEIAPNVAKTDWGAMAKGGKNLLTSGGLGAIGGHYLGLDPNLGGPKGTGAVLTGLASQLPSLLNPTFGPAAASDYAFRAIARRRGGGK
jgi:hypothetical protein